MKIHYDPESDSLYIRLSLNANELHAQSWHKQVLGHVAIRFKKGLGLSFRGFSALVISNPNPEPGGVIRGFAYIRSTVGQTLAKV